MNPVFLPIPKSYRDQSLTVEIKALFCSFACGFQYCEEIQDIYSRKENIEQLKQFFVFKHNKYPSVQKYPPSKYSLQKFGGDTTNE